jgi:hypothetical protein
MFGIGKTTVYKVLKSKSEEFSDLVLLGEGNVEDSLPVSREFVASLYDQKSKLRADYSNLNKFRAALFVRISRYGSAKMLLVHADGMSLPMVVAWPGLLLFCCKSNSEFIEIRVICS